MRRAPFVVAGTVAGVAGVLAFPVHRAHLTIPSVKGPNSGNDNGGLAAGAPSVPPSTEVPGAAPPNSDSTATTAPPATSPPAARSATGSEISFMYGDMAVTLTVSGNRITDVSMSTISETDGRSVSIDRFAIPQLEQQVIDAGSLNIDGVSGATFTSQAFVDSASSALKKLGFG